MRKQKSHAALASSIIEADHDVEEAKQTDELDNEDVTTPSKPQQLEDSTQLILTEQHLNQCEEFTVKNINAASVYSRQDGNEDAAHDTYDVNFNLDNISVSQS